MDQTISHRLKKRACLIPIGPCFVELTAAGLFVFLSLKGVAAQCPLSSRSFPSSRSVRGRLVDGGRFSNVNKAISQPRLLFGELDQHLLFLRLLATSRYTSQGCGPLHPGSRTSTSRTRHLQLLQCALLYPACLAPHRLLLAESANGRRQYRRKSPSRRSSSPWQDHADLS